MAKIISVTGCSCVGKDAILSEVIKRTDVKPIISTTSRPMRIGETQGVEYNFVEEETAINMLDSGDFIEHRLYSVADGSKWIYGITKDSIDLESNNIYIVIVDLQGLKQLDKYLMDLGQDIITSIYIDTSCQERLLRSLRRENKMNDVQVKEVCRRLLDDEEKVKPARDYCTISFTNETEEDLENNIYTICKIANVLKEIN